MLANFLLLETVRDLATAHRLPEYRLRLEKFLVSEEESEETAGEDLQSRSIGTGSSAGRE